MSQIKHQATHLEDLVGSIIAGIREKKGVEITVIDLQSLANSVTSAFVICNGNSDKQTQAIADSIKKQVSEEIGEKPWHVEGQSRGEWILMDYVEVVVHIFLPRVRDYYRIEELWGDAPQEHYQA